ncbi:MAG: hypothetical protein R6X22_06440 [Gemmatimonadota bacterium]
MPPSRRRPRRPATLAARDVRLHVRLHFLPSRDAFALRRRAPLPVEDRR